MSSIRKKEQRDQYERLTTIILLHGNKRIPYLEKEIFSSKKIAHFYLKHLLPGELRMGEAPTIPYLICAYSCHAINGRWIEAEEILFKHAGWKDYYKRIHCL